MQLGIVQARCPKFKILNLMKASLRTIQKESNIPKQEETL